VGDLVKMLNENAGAVVAIATVVYAVLTFLLLRESRLARLPGNLIVAPTPFGRGLYVAVVIHNLGPAPVTDVDVEVWESNADGSLVGSRLHVQEPFVFPGGERRLLPDKQNPTGPRTLAELADAHVRLSVKYSWRDGRRSWLILAKRHEVARDYPYEVIRQGLHRGEVLADRDFREQMDRIGEALEGIKEKLSH
jgi:hypothetical protein